MEIVWNNNQTWTLCDAWYIDISALAACSHLHTWYGHAWSERSACAAPGCCRQNLVAAINRILVSSSSSARITFLPLFWRGASDSVNPPHSPYYFINFLLGYLTLRSTHSWSNLLCIVTFSYYRSSLEPLLNPSEQRGSGVIARKISLDLKHAFVSAQVKRQPANREAIKQRAEIFV